jgi:putative ABC transport system permease protein
VDSNGYFYTNLSFNQIKEISQSVKVEIKVVSENQLSYDNIFKKNLLQFIILIIATLSIMYIYTIFRYKTNAVKKLIGFSPTKIIVTHIKETLKIEGILMTVLVMGYSVYFWMNNKFSWTYVIFLILFLTIVSISTILLLLLLQHFVRKMDIVAALKNKIFSKSLNIIIHIVKIILILSVTISITICINYREKLHEVYKKCDDYKLLNSLYSSYGRNTDEYDKLRNGSEKLKKTSNNVKRLYNENKDQAYVMFDPVRDNFNKKFLAASGMTREKIMNSYEINYIILNKNYIENYTDIQMNWNFNQSSPTILVPEKYKKYEKNIKKHYIERYNSALTYNTRYGIKDKDVKINDIQIIYIENGLKYKILSSISYENEIDIELFDSVIILDNGSFGSCFYYDMLGSCELAFKLNDRNEFKSMLIQYDLNSLYMANTMLTPFESAISSYKFLLDQANIFVFLFIILLVFIIYISNYIDMIVNGKIYASMYMQGYHLLRILKANIVTTIILMSVAIVLYILKVNILIYLLYILYDLITMIYLYKKFIVKELYKVLNGGC